MATTSMASSCPGLNKTQASEESMEMILGTSVEAPAPGQGFIRFMLFTWFSAEENSAFGLLTL